jgi:choline dehydrogenase-like flavoprotein
VAAGAINTPAILSRSGLDNPNVGKHFRVHPVLIVWGLFDDEVNPWEGVFGSTFSDEFLDMGEGYGVKYEHASNPPSLLAVFAPWRSAEHNAELMQSLRHTAGFGCLMRTRDGGEIVTGEDGLPVATWELSEFDRQNMRRAADGAAQILEAGGAKRIYSSHAAWVSYEPGEDGARERWLDEADRAGWGPAQVTLGAFHLMGTARMGSSREDSVCAPDGQAWDCKGLYVVDGSLLPTGLGVNPMITIEAAAHKVARGIVGAMTPAA